MLAQGRLKDWGPLLVIWGGAMLVLFATNDLGSALLYYGIFLALLYIATARLSFVAAALGLFLVGAYAVGRATPHVQERITDWLDAVDDEARSTARRAGHMVVRQQCQSYQLVQSLYGIAHGGWVGTGLGRGIVTTAGGTQIVPDQNTDFIYSAIAQEIGLVGAAALLLLYMAFVLRGFQIALAASDGFSKLLAAGLSFGFALQTFVIVGGILRVIPLTGITLPFVSYGGSSVVSNFFLVAGLMLISNRANRDRRSQREHAASASRRRRGSSSSPCSSAATTYWQSWAGGELANRQGNAVQLVAQLQIDRGTIFAANGTRLAWSVPHKKDGLTTYSRNYTTNGAFSQVVGYATTGQTQTGLEQSLNDFLTGSNTTLTNTFSQEVDRLGGKTVHGDNVTLTLKPSAQKLAEQLLAGRCGAVVAMNPKTGAVYAMASSPTYDPNLILRRNGYREDREDQGDVRRRVGALGQRDAGPLSAGLDVQARHCVCGARQRRFTPYSDFYDPGYCIEYGQARLELEQPRRRSRGVRQRHALAGSRALDQLRLLQRREAARRREDPRLREAVRLLLLAAARHAVEHDLPERPLQERQGSSIPKDPVTQRRPRPARVRPGARWSSRRSRWRSSPRRSATTATSRCRTSSRRSPRPDGSVVSTTTPSTLGRPISAENRGGARRR